MKIFEPNTMLLLCLFMMACNESNSLQEAHEADVSIEKEEMWHSVSEKVQHHDSFVNDKQGNRYAVMRFRNQLWITSNCLQTVFNNGDKIKEAKNAREWFKATQNKEPVWCYLNYDSTNKSLYGVYYNWYAVNDPRGLAPEDWSIAPNQQCRIMARELNFDAHHIKELSYWKAKRYVYNSTGFSARPGGLVGIDGEFRDVGDVAYFWTATQKNTEKAMYFEVRDEFNNIYFSDLPHELGMNIRYFKKLLP